jgi:DNA-binding CsgD family transcriptional regulator
LREELLGDIGARVPFAWHAWALSDPETEVAISPLATVPDTLMAQLPGIIRRRYLTQVNRWDRVEAPVSSLHRATAGRLDRSLLHRELLGPHGVGDVAAVVFRDGFGLWGWLDLWRRADAPPFTDAELRILGEDVDVVTEALRRAQARSFDEPASEAPPTGPAVLFLSPELKVLGQTPDTDSYLRALLPTEGDRQPVPAGAYNVAAALIASEAGVFDHPPVARVRPVGGTWLTFRAARVDADRAPEDRDIAVTITLSSPTERRSLYGLAHGLTPRERQLLDLLSEGADTKAIAGAMHLSEHTVQDHLKAVFAKTGTRNRRTLLARLAGR